MSIGSGLDAHVIDATMMEMLWKDCEKTAKLIETNGFYRFCEEHIEGVEIASEMAFQFSLACLYCQDMKARQRVETVEEEVEVREAKSGNSAAKIGDTNQTARSFTREDIINALDGVTEESTEIAKAIQNKDIGINVLGDELFERYLGATSDTVAMQVGDQIYMKSSSSSLISDVVHEGVHAIDYLNGVDESIISSWTGEIKAYSAERLFQIESGMPVQFASEEDMMVHIWSNYSR